MNFFYIYVLIWQLKTLSFVMLACVEVFKGSRYPFITPYFNRLFLQCG